MKRVGQIRPKVHAGPKRWDEVVALVGTSDPVSRTAAKCAKATEKDLRKAMTDPAFIECIRLLVLIPQAAQTDDFAASLLALDLRLSEAPRFADVLMAASTRIDLAAADPNHRKEFLQRARGAFFETMATKIGNSLPGVLEIQPGDFQQAAARLARPNEFAASVRVFFGGLLSSTLAYWLNRILPVDTGPGRRFPEPNSLEIFTSALARFCDETTRIIQEFSVGWYSGAFRSPAPGLNVDVAGFSKTALEKIISELQRKTGADD